MNNLLFSKLQIEPAVLFIGDDVEYIDRDVIDFEWNMVVTTSVTSDVAIELSNGQRNVSEVFEKCNMKANLLDPTDLHIIRLLGKNIDFEELDDDDVEDLRYTATGILERITEIVRKAGVIVLEAFNNDIIRHKDIVRAFRKLVTNERQLFVFNAGDEEKKAYKKLVDAGIAVLFEESLNDYFAEYDIISLHPSSIDATNTVQIYIGAGQSGKITNFHKENLLETKSFATLLNISLLEKIKVGENMYEDYFYSFLRNSVKEPQWYGYRCGFNIKRKFEDRLYSLAKDGLEHIGDKSSKPLLLVGQTGSGKSIALASLAYRIFYEKQYPVIFINNPDTSLFDSNIRMLRSLDLLIQRIEEIGASGVLLVWDSCCYSTSKKAVSNLHTKLLGRGRKVFIVASAYENQENVQAGAKDDSFRIESSIIDKQFKTCHANIVIDDEKKQLRAILVDKCGIGKREADEVLNYHNDEQNFLTLFYQAFAILRNELAEGVKREATFNLNDINETAKTAAEKQEEKLNNENSFSLLFKEAFQRAKDDITKAGFDTTDENGLNQKSNVEAQVDDFIRCIAVCSQFKFEMPYDMALRILGTEHHEVLSVLLTSSFFVMRQNQQKNYKISLRTAQEARMYLRANKLRPIDQVDYIIKILKNMNPSEAYGQAAEVALCEKLIRTIGPNDNYRTTYIVGYEKIIEALGDIRKSGIVEIKLIEQEVTYIREYYGKGDFDTETKIKWLKEAIRISQEILEDPYILDPSKEGDRRTLIVENSNSRLLLFDLEETSDYYYLNRTLQADLEKVIANDHQNYHAYVTLLKSYISEYRKSNSEDKKTELLEYLLNWKEQLDLENNDVVESDYFIEQFTTVYHFLDDTTIAQNYIDEMAAQGFASGIYITAKKILHEAGVDFRQRITNSVQFDACKAAYEYLKTPKYLQVVYNNKSCQYMMLNLVWLLNDGNPIFQKGERWFTSIKNEAWQEILDICQNYLDKFIVSGETNRVEKSIKYIKALSLAQLGNYLDSMKTITSIGEDPTLGRTRTYTMHILCDAQGNPRKFHGIIDSYDDTQRNGEMTISEYGNYKVYFFGPNLETARLDEGSRFDDVEVGLGYIGPKAFRSLKKS